MIHHNSSLSNPIPLSEGTPARASAPAGLPVPSDKIDSTPVEFSGSGGEYFRIWIVNLLLTIVTFGFYYPWAKVRKLKYFYNNTHLDGHALEFHGEPKKMLRGTLIAGVLFSIYSVAAEFSLVAGLIAVLVLMGIAPVLFRAAMRFRLANTSWRGMRMRFTAPDLKEAYAVIVPALAMFLLPGFILAFLADEPAGKSSALPISGAGLGLYALALAIAVPYFFWRLKRYQHNHYAWGPLKAEYRSEVGATYQVFGLTLLMVALMVALFAAIVWLMIPSQPGSIRNPKGLWTMMWLLIPLFFVFIVSINILPRAYFTATMQNLLWSRTGNRYFRFKSELAAPRFIGLQVKNYLLIAITFGLYWPFAVINTLRMRLEAVSLKTRIPLDKLSDAVRAREKDAAGDMAADIFGFDVGM
ncbi:MAG: YjgN family protein [Brachymonas sp.]